jgi:predicted enzyme related to lactoylglutathione lyase
MPLGIAMQRFKSGIIESPVCRRSVCVDSEGNSILLHQLKPKPA